MIFREATTNDIKQMQIVRNAVSENILSNPDLIKDKDYEVFLTKKGKGWVCLLENRIVGFAIVDVRTNNIWALFILPSSEGKGIGRKLQDIMLDWYFTQTQTTAWLETGSGTRAEKFYKKTGWLEISTSSVGEVKFEMNYEVWKMKRKI